MMDYVLTTGPLSICIDSTPWSTYTGGVLSACGTNANINIDHCAQIVGVDAKNQVWKIRNTWDTNWGVQGHIFLKTGKNVCGITDDPTFVSVALVGRI